MVVSGFDVCTRAFVPVVALLVWALPTQPVAAASRGNGNGSLESVYQRWSAARPRGDRDVIRIGIAGARGLTPPSRARGVFEANVQTGAVSVRIRRLGQPAEVWLVDNQPGAGLGAGILPDAGDALKLLGRLELEGFESTLSTQLDAAFFDSFQIDLVVVTSVGTTPLDERLLIGALSGFERRRLAERTPGARRQRHDRGGAPDPRVRLGLVSAEVLRGGELFFRDTFGGNGRTCGSCHPVDNNLTIDRDFIRALRRKNPSDALFVAEKGHPNHVPELEVPDMLRRFAMILENVDGFEAPTEKFLLRSVPHSLSMATSIAPVMSDNPNAPIDTLLADGSTLRFQERTGWSGDGAPMPGTLRLFQVGAIIQHYTKDVFDRRPSTPGASRDNFRLPSDEELDDIEAYLLTTGRTRDLDLSAITLADARAEAGRRLFNQDEGGAKCSVCHFNAGADARAGGNRNLNTGNERARLPAVDDRGIPRDGGFGGQNESDFNFDADGDGLFDAFGNGTFNTPPLIEAADTPPFFHTNAFDTIEAAVEFYTSEAFAESPGGELMVRLFGEGIALDDEQIEQVGAFLRVINAALNMAMAEQRLAAALAIDEAGGRARSSRRISERLVELAGVELLDARAVLARNGLNRAGHRLLRTAIHQSRHSIDQRDAKRRRQAIERALELTIEARQRLGTGLEFELGEGNLVF